MLVPLALSGKGLEGGRLGQVLLAFLALSLMTGATYLLNDIVDLPHDRRHRSKRSRPLASGRLSIAAALAAAPIAIIASLLVGARVSPWVAAFLVIYLAGTLAYSFGLKQIPCVDAVTLGGLFTVRLVIGTFAAGVAASAWLLVFSMFLFTSLSYAKRYAEIMRFRTSTDGQLRGRGYAAGDGPLVLAFGVASGLSASLILILYIIEDVLTNGAYQNKIGLWLLPLLLRRSPRQSAGAIALCAVGVAIATLIAQVPHFVYHALHLDLLPTTLDRALQTISLGLALLVPIVVLIASREMREGPAGS